MLSITNTKLSPRERPAEAQKIVEDSSPPHRILASVLKSYKLHPESSTLNVKRNVTRASGYCSHSFATTCKHKSGSQKAKTSRVNKQEHNSNHRGDNQSSRRDQNRQSLENDNLDKPRTDCKSRHSNTRNPDPMNPKLLNLKPLNPTYSVPL